MQTKKKKDKMMFETNRNFSQSILNETKFHQEDLIRHKKDLSSCSLLVDEHDKMNNTIDICKV